MVISKTEYLQLKRQSRAFQKLAGRIFEATLKDPIEDVVADFSKTGLYSNDFLVDLESGLKKSSYVS